MHLIRRSRFLNCSVQRPVVWTGGGVRVRNVTLRTAGGGWGPQQYAKLEEEWFKRPRVCRDEQFKLIWYARCRWMKSIQVVRASDSQCRSRNCHVLEFVGRQMKQC
jgi:hypothetical protein